MKDFVLYFVLFVSGVLLTLITYNVIIYLCERDNEACQKLSKKERIIKLECEVNQLKNELRRIDYPLLMSVQQFEYSRRMAERNKK